jgi:hypothetical protein
MKLNRRCPSPRPARGLMGLMIGLALMGGAYRTANGDAGATSQEAVDDVRLASLRGGNPVLEPPPGLDWCVPYSDCAGTDGSCVTNGTTGKNLGDPCGTMTVYGNLNHCDLTSYNDTSCSGPRVYATDRVCTTTWSCSVQIVGGNATCYIVVPAISQTLKSDWNTVGGCG